jgi:hypothetical protein
MMVLLYQNSPDEIRRIAVLVDFQRIENFYFETDAAQVNYNAKTVETVMLETLGAGFNQAEMRRPTWLVEGCRKVVGQIRQAEAYLSTRPEYEDPVIEEEVIQYPKLRNVDARGIRRLRR